MIRRLVFIAIFVSLLIALPGAAGIALAEDAPADSPASEAGLKDAPTLSIPIPDVRFTKIKVEGAEGDQYIDIPWLAQYISGVYKYAVAVATMIAAVMIMIGGFQYLTAGGDATRVGKGKEKIQNAIIGLFLTLGSYLILYAVNPDLVELSALRVKIVQRIDFPVDATLGYTTVATALDDPSAGSSESSSGSGPATTGSHTPSTTTCPFTLSATTGRAGRFAFYEAIHGSGSPVTASGVRDRILQVADVADACNVSLGSCGRTVGTIYSLAGAGLGSGCLNPPTDRDCNGNYRRETKAVTREQRRHMAALRCKDTPYEVGESRIPAQSPCESTSTSATTNVREFLFEQKRGGAANLRDWPDGWADTLLPGDYVVLYNGNSDYMGSHAVVFVGWSSNRNSMQVIQGGQGGSGAERNVTRPGSICVREACRDRMVPITYIRTP